MNLKILIIVYRISGSMTYIPSGNPTIYSLIIILILNSKNPISTRSWYVVWIKFNLVNKSCDGIYITLNLIEDNVKTKDNQLEMVKGH